MYTFKKVLCPISYGAGLRRSTAPQPKKLYGFCALKLMRSTCGKSNLNAAKIVNCVYNFLLHYSGTLIKNSILSSVKICCGVCLKSQCHPQCFVRLCFCFEVWLARLPEVSQIIRAAVALQQADIYSSSL